jgi:predicted transcriptional regulator
MDGEVDRQELVELTADIVSAYVTNNTVVRQDVPMLISEVHEALVKAAQNRTIEKTEELKPAVPIKKSISNDFLICLEDGKKFRSLKRHLMSHYNLTPEEYREKWNLPRDYPMVAPGYAKQRSELAKSMGLGQRKAARAKK